MRNLLSMSHSEIRQTNRDNKKEETMLATKKGGMDRLERALAERKNDFIRALREQKAAYEDGAKQCSRELELLEGSNGKVRGRRGRPAKSAEGAAEAAPVTISDKLLDLRGAKPSNLDGYVLLILGNSEEPLPVEAVETAVQKAGYVSKADNFLSIIRTCLHRNKEEGLITRDKREGRLAFYKLTAKGKKAVEKLIAEAAEAPKQEAKEKNGSTGKTEKIGKLDDVVLLCIKEAKDPIDPASLVNAVLDKGYVSKTGADKFGGNVAGSVQRLKDSGMIKVKKDGRKAFYTVSAKGKRYKVKLAA